MITAVENADQESTGFSGCIPETEKDIHCAAIPGPDYKLNYYVARCRQRLAEKTCESYGCNRFVGEVKVIRGRKQRVITKKIGRPGIGGKKECVACEDVKRIKARDLCHSCYRYHDHRGTLKQFPTMQEQRNQALKEGVN